MQSAISTNIFQDIQRRKYESYVVNFKIIFQSSNTSLDKSQTENEIYKAMLTLHGQAGVAFSPELLEFDEETMSGSIKISTSAIVRLWSALTLKSDIDGGRCAIRIIRVDPCEC